MLKDEDLSKAFKILDNIDTGDILDLERIPGDRRNLFIQCAKQYIDSRCGGEFNKDFTKFKKLQKWE